MNTSSKIETFWKSYLSTLPEADQMHAAAYIVSQFADTPEAATSVGKLVRDGIKTTTSTLVWGLEHNHEHLPEVGMIEIIVDGNNDPLCITELMEVTVRPFNAVDEQFAFEYGEGDRTLDFWLTDNWEFLSRECIEIGHKPSRTMPIAFQRFRVLYPVHPNNGEGK